MVDSVTDERSAGRVNLESGGNGSLSNSELWWRDRYHDIVASGYELRPRYDPGFQPSWTRKTSRKDFFVTDDVQPTPFRSVIDATQANPSNHCVALLELIDTGGTKLDKRLMVMPFLRPFNHPQFVAFFIQICEGLQFMHQNNVAHRDCTVNNIMFDPSNMYPKGYHISQINRSRDLKGRAERHTRTDRPPRYYLINFGLSRKYFSRDVVDEPLRGGDETTPEHLLGGRCNPFRTDIYNLGNVVREQFLVKCNGFEFMQGLVDEMTDESPERRPTIEGVIKGFDHIRSSLSTIKLRSLISLKKDPRLFTASRHVRQLIRTARYIVLKKAAIPIP
ncbi:kinase-like domain-containing protein [Lactarius sanguifluus]|nr:kinase-like domain-containing protein [Lactarius sanguifluus]